MPTRGKSRNTNQHGFRGKPELDGEASSDRDRPGPGKRSGTGQISAKPIALAKVMTVPELEALEKKMLAPMQADKAGGQRHRAAEASGAELIAPILLTYLAIREIAPENRVTQACS